MRWNRTSKGFMEVWYVTLNHRETGTGAWIRYTIGAPIKGDPYCELWAAAFDPSDGPLFTGKLRYPIDRLGASGRDDGALVRIADAWLSESHLEGEVAGESRSMSWSLDLEPAARCYRHIPEPLSGRIARRISTVCSPNLSVPFTGSIKVGDRLLEFSGEPGTQSHRWGRSHPSTWAWSHCSSFDGEEDAVFEAVAGRSNLGPVPLPTATFVLLHLDGKDLVFNDLRWAIRARSSYEMPTWAFSTHNGRFKIVGATRAETRRFAQVTYEDPDGSQRFCANSEVGSLALEVYARQERGWVHLRSLTATSSAHLEFGRRVPFPELPISI